MKQNGHQWKSVDWRMTDARIAEQVGCTKQWVHQKRKSLGKGKALLHGYKPKMIRLLKRSKIVPIDQAVSGEPPYMRPYYRTHLRKLIAHGALEVA